MSDLVFTLVSRGFGWNLMREIFSSLDGAIFSLFSAVIQLMFNIVSVTAKEGFFDDIYRRIYVIVSIYMLFKVTVSLITYVVNPDSMTDKSQGVGNLVQRIMISFMMLIIFPTVFTKLMDYQKDILQDHTIDNIILGARSVNDQQNQGDAIGVGVYDGFIIRQKDTTLDNTTTTGRLTKVSDVTEIINEPLEGNKDEYKYEYIPLIGFAMGVFMTLLILSFCIDLAIRVFKLIILQLLAPVAIISYIDPKASKDGAFSKWSKMLGSTWLSLFVRLIVIDFILLIISGIIGSGDLALENVGEGGIMVKIALIIGLLFFAKNLPKFIGDALGIKIEGGLFSGLGQIAAAGAIGLGAFGAGIATARAAAGPIDADHKFKSYAGNIGKGLFHGTAGALGAAAGGALAVGKAKDNYGKAAVDARNKYLANQLSGNTAAARAFSTLAGLATGYDIDREISRAGAIAASAEKVFGYAKSEGAKKFSDVVNEYTWTDASGNEARLSMSRNDLKMGLSAANANGGHVIVKGVDLGAVDGNVVGKLSGDADEFVGNQFMDAVDSGIIEDKAGALDAYRVSYANALGISKEEASKHRSPELKVSQKSNETKKFNLQQKKGGK